MLRIAVAGVGGRMGRALVEACCDAADVTLTAALARPGSAVVGHDAGELAGRAPVGITVTDDAAAAVEACEVLVDFTIPEASVLHADLCGRTGRAMVIGTTGLDADQRGRVAAATASVPVVLAPNMSVGVNLCLRLIEMAAGVLGEDADVEISEAHHRHKVDAPSGTALRMGDVVARTLGRSLDECAIYGRQGRTGPRDRAAIGFSVLRGGDIVGEHTVLFAGDGERVEITHKASSRTTFAGGAVRAARWVVGRPPGLYEMADVLGL